MKVAAHILFLQEHWEEAYELKSQMVEVRVDVMGLEHPETLDDMADLAAYLRMLNCQEEPRTWDHKLCESASGFAEVIIMRPWAA